MLDKKIGLIGAGQMAGALARGMTRGGLVKNEQLVAFDPDSAALARLLDAHPGAIQAASNAELVEAADVVLLAVKPQVVPAVGQDLNGSLGNPAPLLISIAAGVTLRALGERFGSERLIRVMPNTPCLLGAGASAYCPGAGATVEDLEVARQLLASVGLAIQVSESQLDAVTGLSGSGPAYVYLVIEALSDGGVRMGLPREVASRLAAQTVLGAAHMVLESDSHPAELREQVTSPGGTTSAGLQELEVRAVRGAFIGAVQRATERAQQLGDS